MSRSFRWTPSMRRLWRQTRPNQLDSWSCLARVTAPPATKPSMHRPRSPGPRSDDDLARRPPTRASKWSICDHRGAHARSLSRKWAPAAHFGDSDRAADAMPHRSAGGVLHALCDGGLGLREQIGWAEHGRTRCRPRLRACARAACRTHRLLRSLRCGRRSVTVIRPLVTTPQCGQ